MISTLLHVLRLVPFLCGGHHQLALENLAPRQQLAVYKRTTTRPKLRRTDRLFWVWLARVWAGWRQSLLIVTPETVLRWQRRRFREHWTELSGRPRVGRPPINAEIGALVRTRMHPTDGQASHRPSAGSFRFPKSVACIIATSGRPPDRASSSRPTATSATPVTILPFGHHPSLTDRPTLRSTSFRVGADGPRGARTVAWRFGPAFGVTSTSPADRVYVVGPPGAVTGFFQLRLVEDCAEIGIIGVTQSAKSSSAGVSS